MRVKYTLDAEDDDMILALRAARSALKHPSFRDGVIAFGDHGGPTTDFYVKRNKSGVFAKQMAK